MKETELRSCFYHGISRVINVKFPCSSGGIVAGAHAIGLVLRSNLVQVDCVTFIRCQWEPIMPFWHLLRSLRGALKMSRSSLSAMQLYIAAMYESSTNNVLSLTVKRQRVIRNC